MVSRPRDLRVLSVRRERDAIGSVQAVHRWVVPVLEGILDRNPVTVPLVGAGPQSVGIGQVVTRAEGLSDLRGSRDRDRSGGPRPESRQAKKQIQAKDAVG